MYYSISDITEHNNVTIKVYYTKTVWYTILKFVDILSTLELNLHNRKYYLR
jgi:hypothetical protein